MTPDEIQKKLEEARVWIKIIEESQATRKKYGVEVASDLSLELSHDASSAMLAIDTLEKEVFGGVISALRARIDNVERALRQRGAQ